MDGHNFATVVPRGGTTSADFKDWLADAKAGAVFAYHHGSLALATNSHGEALPYGEKQTLARLAHCAWLAAVDGRVHLLQRRLANNSFEYLAVARPQSAKLASCRSREKRIALPSARATSIQSDGGSSDG